MGSGTSELVNLHRYANLAGGLRWSDELADVAMKHAQDMYNRRYFSHDSPEGENIADRVAKSDYVVAIVKNIARGDKPMASVIDAWMAMSYTGRTCCWMTIVDLGAARVTANTGCRVCLHQQIHRSQLSSPVPMVTN